MALQVPSEPKVNTKVYDNLRGVDFTNDASNVYVKRSPDAVNMIPNMDGSPRKRHGWEIAVSAQDFADAMAQPPADDIIIYKLAYPEIGGEDFILVFTNAGLFAYSETPNSLGDNLGLVSTIIFNHTRSFFFEGQGTAGYYVFNGLDLYRFGGYDGYNAYIFGKVTPYYPITHIACNYDHSSATTYENINMLTPIRRVQFMGDGSNATFYLPTNADSIQKVEWLNSNGEWANVPKTTGDKHYTNHVNSGSVIDGVTLNWTLASSTEDNLRVTYTGANSTNTVTDKTMTRPYQTATVTHVGSRDCYCLQWTNLAGKKSAITKTSYSAVKWSKYEGKTLSFDSSKIKLSSAYKVQYKNGSTASDLAAGYRTISFGSYNNTMNVSVGKALFDNITPVTDKTTYGGDVLVTGTKKEYAITASTKGYIENLLIGRGFGYSIAHQIANNGKSVTIWTETSTVRRARTYSLRIQYHYDEVTNSALPDATKAREAFKDCSRAIIYGNGIINQVFMGACQTEGFKNRIWYSGATDPTYFPDLNYFEVGANDTQVMGMIKVGEYLGIIKQGSTLDSSVYLAYPTSFNNDTAYAVKQKVAGVGAVSNGAFNVLNDEPLFLSKEGVMAIIPSENEEKQLKNRSYYINKKLLAEDCLSEAVSFVWENMYLLAVNNEEKSLYILDGAQKSSWANERTNLQYECYYCENIPAQCFAKIDDILYFSDDKGNLCRFKTDDDDYPWYDEYSADGADPVTEDTPDFTIEVTGDTSNYVTIDRENWTDKEAGTTTFAGSFGTNTNAYEDPDNEYTEDWLYTGVGDKITPAVGGLWYVSGTYDPDTGTKGQGAGDHVDKMFTWNGEEYVAAQPTWMVDYTAVALSDYGITVPTQEWDRHGYSFSVTKAVITITGAPILTRWSTIMDDDGAPQYFKNLQKKGTMVILTPAPDSGVDIYLKADNKEPIQAGTIDAQNPELPIDVYTKKKIKKYKRLQFICENNEMLDSFGIDQIIKSYTVGNYSKNR